MAAKHGLPWMVASSRRRELKPEACQELGIGLRVASSRRRELKPLELHRFRRQSNRRLLTEA